MLVLSAEALQRSFRCCSAVGSTSSLRLSVTFSISSDILFKTEVSSMLYETWLQYAQGMPSRCARYGKVGIKQQRLKEWMYVTDLMREAT